MTRRARLASAFWRVVSLGFLAVAPVIVVAFVMFAAVLMMADRRAAARPSSRGGAR